MMYRHNKTNPIKISLLVMKILTFCVSTPQMASSVLQTQDLMHILSHPYFSTHGSDNYETSEITWEEDILDDKSE